MQCVDPIWILVLHYCIETFWSRGNWTVWVLDDTKKLIFLGLKMFYFLLNSPYLLYRDIMKHDLMDGWNLIYLTKKINK